MASQYTEKQIRNGAVGSDYAPVPGRDPLSDDALKYVAQAARLQREAASDPALNGENARLHGNG